MTDRPDSEHEPIPLAPDSAAPPPPPAKPLAEDEHIPVARARPLLELADDHCPRCGVVLASDQVVCLKCGYDQRANTVLEPRTGPPVAHPEDAAAADAPPEFVEPGRGTAQTVAIIGAVCTLGAMIAAGVNTPAGGGAVLVIGRVALTLYETVLYSAVGVVAVYLAAYFAEERFTRPELAAARMFLAFSVFQLVVSCGIPLGNPTLSAVVALALGVGLYYLAVLVLFRKDRWEAFLIMGCHVVLWLIISVGVELASWVTIRQAAVQEQKAAAG